MAVEDLTYEGIEGNVTVSIGYVFLPMDCPANNVEALTKAGFKKFAKIEGRNRVLGGSC